MSFRRCSWVLVCLALLALIAGCASNPATKTAEVDGRILIGPNLNPDADGRPSPVFLRIYQLKDKAEFESASYGDLADNDQQALGASLLSRDEIELCPVEQPKQPRSGQAGNCQGKEKDITLKVSGAARYLAVMGEFYDLQDQSGSWRAVAAIPEEGWLGLFGSRSFVISLKRATVSVGFE